MNFPMLVTAVYGIFNIIGGVIGYLKASSTASLIAGGISGVILIICSYGIAHNNKIGVIGGIIVSVLLCGRFIPALIKEFKVMPGLIVVVLGILTIISLIPLLKS